MDDTRPQDVEVHIRPQDDALHDAVERAGIVVRHLGEAWRQFAEQLIPVVRRLHQALQPLAEMANSPEGRALIALHEAGLLPARTEHCHCLCGVAHPGVHPCWGPVPPDRMQRVPIWSESFGEVQVSMCPACAELAPERTAAAT